MNRLTAKVGDAPATALPCRCGDENSKNCGQHERDRAGLGDCRLDRASVLANRQGADIVGSKCRINPWSLKCRHQKYKLQLKGSVELNYIAAVGRREDINWYSNVVAVTAGLRPVRARQASRQVTMIFISAILREIVDQPFLKWRCKADTATRSQATRRAAMSRTSGGQRQSRTAHSKPFSKICAG